MSGRCQRCEATTPDVELPLCETCELHARAQLRKQDSWLRTNGGQPTLQDWLADRRAVQMEGLRLEMVQDLSDWDRCRFWLAQARSLSLPFSSSSSIQLTCRLERKLEALVNADKYRRLAKAAVESRESGCAERKEKRV